MVDNTKIRVATDILLVLSVLYFPWQIAAILGIISAFIFGNFIELILLGLFVDLLYGVPQTPQYLRYMFTGYAVVVIMVSYIVRKRVLI